MTEVVNLPFIIPQPEPQPEPQEPSLLPPVPMIDHMRVIAQLQQTQERSQRMASIIDVLKSQIANLHEAHAASAVDLVMAQRTIEQQQQMLRDAEARGR